MISANRLIIIIPWLLFLLNCRGNSAGELVLFDFESDSALDQLVWKCHTLYSLSTEHVTHGKKSLKMELYPSDYPGLTPIIKENDWSGYNKLCFDIYNPQEKIKITVRIDDQKVSPDYGDRYNESFTLEQGMNKISVPLDTLVTSGTKRNLNLKKIKGLLIFVANPGKRVDLYADYIRLDR